jgi:CheY-like chemotaxis protein
MTWFKNELYLLAGLDSHGIQCAEAALGGLGEILAVNDAEGLLETLRTRRVSLVVMDVDKPAMRASETLNRVWRDPEIPSVPVIQASKAPDGVVEPPKPPPGWACYLEKPVRGKPLLEKAWVLMKLAGYSRAAKERGAALDALREELARKDAEIERLEGELARLRERRLG